MPGPAGGVRSEPEASATDLVEAGRGRPPGFPHFRSLAGGPGGGVEGAARPLREGHPLW